MQDTTEAPVPETNNNSSEFGTTEGELSVSLSGGAVYNIPIAVPPGINGVAPAISLSYNSQSGNGLAGYGWNIGGLSAITRVPSTTYHDNAISAVNFTASDRFALDGQRLLLSSGTYGKDNAVYQTENFSNIKITSHGVSPHGANYGPAYFMVYYPDGSYAQYGQTNVNSPLDYAIAYWSNPQGIRINYTYTVANNTTSLSSITYGGTDTAPPIHEIRFVYKTRANTEQSFIGVGQVSFYRTTLLSAIQVKAEGSGFRNYELTHNLTSVGYERLTAVQEKSGDNSKSYNPVTFSYEDTANSRFTNDANSTIDLTNTNYTNTDMVSGDFTGNGKIDFILYPTTGTNNRSLYHLYTDIDNRYNVNLGVTHPIGKFRDIFPVSWLNSENKLSSYQGWTVVQEAGDKVTFTTYSGPGGASPIHLNHKKEYTFPKFIYYTRHPLACHQPSRPDTRHEMSVAKRYISGDFTGNGLTDILAIENQISYQNTYCDQNNNPQVITTHEWGSAYLINLDRRVTTNFVTRVGAIVAVPASKIMVADINGDGKADIMLFDKGTLNVYSIDNNNRLQFIASYADPVIDTTKPILLGDYNGDGKIDFAIPQGVNQDSWNFYFSTGIGFSKKTTWLGFTYRQSVVAQQNVLDVNGQSYGNYYCLREVHYIPGDFNGDGKTDILFQQTYTAVGQSNPGKKDGDPILTVIKPYENKIANPNTVHFFYNKTVGAQRADLNKYAIPVFLTNEKKNHHLEYALVSRNKILHFTNQKDSREDVLLRKVTNGDQVSESIAYHPLINDTHNGYYQPSTNTEVFPNTDITIAPGFKMVSKITHTYESVTKQKEFKYYGAVSNTEGLGFLGFRGVLKTNWYEDSKNPVYTVSKQNPALRGATTESFTTLYKDWYFWNTPTDFISKSTITYSTAVLPNKVFKMAPTTHQEFDGLNGTSAVTTTAYDSYNNPLKATTVLKEGTATKQTTVTDLTYSHQTAITNYHIGRPLTKKQTITAYGDTRTTEEQYDYTTKGLLTEIKKKGHQTDFITEANDYDLFGNITKKTISTAGVSPRISSYSYDPSSRFLVSSKDTEGLETQFEYQPATGLLTKETNPYGLTTQYFYDNWGKKTHTTNALGNNHTLTYTKNNTEYSIAEKDEDNSESATVYDALGRILKKGVKNAEGQWAYISYQYDIHNRIIKESEPYLGTEPSLWTTYEYDIYGRLTSTTAPTGRVAKMTYAPLKTTADDGVKTTVTVKDVMGHTVSVNDPGGTVTYRYYANGHLKATSYDQTVITQAQDGWGRKTRLTDPAAGTYHYEYNALGELTKEITPKGTTTFERDATGKLIRKTIKGDLTNMEITYTYDPVTQLLTHLKSVSDGETTTYDYHYDDYKRIYETIEQSPFARYQTTHTYDAMGQIDKTYYEARNIRNGKTASQWIKNTYKNGYHWQIRDNDTGSILWQTDVTNARGQLEKATLGNGITITDRYDTYGFPTAIQHDRTDTAPQHIMTLDYTFDPLKGTLNNRTHSLFSKQETFQYDNLNRLTHFTNAQGNQEEQNYDAKGRITQNNLGVYEYTNSSKAYQNTGITLSNEGLNDYQNHQKRIALLRAETEEIFSNDMESQQGWGWGWDLVKHPLEGDFFSYDATRVHSGQSALKLSNTSTTEQYVHMNQWIAIDNDQPTEYTYSAWIYSESGQSEVHLFMKTEAEEGYFTGLTSITNNVKGEWVHVSKTYTVPADIKLLNIRIGGDAYSAPLILKSDGITQDYYYLHRDNQGTILAVTDQQGTVVEKRHFDAWGAITAIEDEAGNALEGLRILDRGYTGHEHLESVGLVHMNGRLYDAKVHRFLQPDNFVQDPFNTQNFNRYGYCVNNPLTRWLGFVIRVYIR